MRTRKLSAPLCFIAILLFFGFGLPGNIQKKVEKEVGRTFEVEDFILIPLTVRESINEDLPTRITGENFFKVEQKGQLLGYAFVDQAPSKTAKFDYLVIFNTNLEVVTSKVLVYREEYGGEIGSSRWLRQFNGLSGTDRVSPKTNIDAISGATISVRSMTRSVDNLLQTVGKLQENRVL
jgi:Na+-translocating ferredoxin:NAD+ oxidoreductase RnfG subunit